MRSILVIFILVLVGCTKPEDSVAISLLSGKWQLIERKHTILGEVQQDQLDACELQTYFVFNQSQATYFQYELDDENHCKQEIKVFDYTLQNEVFTLMYNGELMVGTYTITGDVLLLHFLTEEDKTTLVLHRHN
ncbi:MAG: lipocalin family protein [Bacteroidota bacterium]|nr:lipocalin family protein [Bacteroidota bacterium]